MNGAVRTAKEICFKNHSNVGIRGADFYVVVDFPYSTLQEPTIPGRPQTEVPISPITQRCEFGACTINAIPLRVCKALTIYKSQGMKAGPVQPFETLVVHLPEHGMKITAGSELVCTLRVTSPNVLAFGNNPQRLTTDFIQKIGRTSAYYDKQWQFLVELIQKAASTQQHTKNAIATLTSLVSYKDVCKLLLDWFVKKIVSAR